jgi:hypothetical protein
MGNTFWTPVVRIAGFDQLDQIHPAEDTNQWLAVLKRELTGFLKGMQEFLVYRPLSRPRKKPSRWMGEGVRGFSLPNALLR